MQYAITAERVGLSISDLEFLSKGQATGRLAARLGVAIADIEDFVNGSSSAAMALRLGLGNNIGAAEELARVNGRDGAIGIVFGLLIAG